MSKDEAYEIIDFAFQLSDKLPETYDQLKSEIKSYIIIVKGDTYYMMVQNKFL